MYHYMIDYMSLFTLHIASHIEERYGGNQNRKKTLAELREELKCIVVQHDDDDDGCAT